VDVTLAVCDLLQKLCSNVNISASAVPKGFLARAKIPMISVEPPLREMFFFVFALPNFLRTQATSWSKKNIRATFTAWKVTLECWRCWYVTRTLTPCEFHSAIFGQGYQRWKFWFLSLFGQGYPWWKLCFFLVLFDQGYQQWKFLFFLVIFGQGYQRWKFLFFMDIFGQGYFYWPLWLWIPMMKVMFVIWDFERPLAFRSAKREFAFAGGNLWHTTVQPGVRTPGGVPQNGTC